ncbi:MAG: NlpC/P60 family protein [Coriobacteriia bacterium]|nr:NlpC/P60 family protein [Coriobacteriia bacterium]
MRDAMISQRTYPRVAAALVASALALGLFAPASALPATPAAPVDAERLASLQSRVDALTAELDALDRDLGIAAEEWNAAREQLALARARADAAVIDLAQAEVALREQQRLLEERAAAIYRNGAEHPLATLLGASSLSDLIARLRFLNALGEADARTVASLSSQRDYARRTAEEAEAAAKRAEELEFELAARKIEIELRIQERQELLANAQAEVLALLAEQSAARQAEEAAFLRRLLAGSQDGTVSVQPGSPVETALAYLGVPYVWGGESPTAGFDCSGLVMYVFRQHGVQLPHYSRAQFALGERVTPADLKPGDVVFFGSPVYHVGIYVGGGWFVHAPRTGDVVRLARLADRRDYAGARRYEWSMRTAPPAGARSTAD